MIQRSWLVPAILVLWCAVAGADSSRYPQYAQHELPKGLKPEFVHLDQVVDEILQRKKPLIIDVRSAQEFRELHIKAAVSIPLDEMPQQIGTIPKDRPLVLY